MHNGVLTSFLPLLQGSILYGPALPEGNFPDPGSSTRRARPRAIQPLLKAPSPGLASALHPPPKPRKFPLLAGTSLLPPELATSVSPRPLPSTPPRTPADPSPWMLGSASVASARKRSSDASRTRSARPRRGPHSCAMAGMRGRRVEAASRLRGVGGSRDAAHACWRPASSGAEPGEGPQSSRVSGSPFSRPTANTQDALPVHYTTLPSTLLTRLQPLGDPRRLPSPPPHTKLRSATPPNAPGAPESMADAWKQLESGGWQGAGRTCRGGARGAHAQKGGT